MPSANICAKCHSRPVEAVDDWQSNYCPPCNDRLLEQAQQRREWDYYHSEDT